MCRSRSDALASQPVSSSPSSASRRHRSSSATSRDPSSSATTTTSTSSLAAVRASLPDPPLLYPFQELAKATNNFLSKRAAPGRGSSSSSYWRCSLRARDAALFQLRSRPGIDAAQASAVLATIARYHHTSVAPLLGACLAGPHVYLAYELPPGPGAATLAACLRNPRNPSFTVLRTWLSRVQVAADVAQGLEYIHHHAAAAHGRVSSSTVLVSDPGLRARLTHFGAAQFAADDATAQEDSREAADVYAFGELLSGEEAARYRLERGSKELVRVTVVETAEEAARSGRVRSWVDRRLGDSFLVAREAFDDTAGAAEHVAAGALRTLRSPPPGASSRSPRPRRRSRRRPAASSPSGEKGEGGTLHGDLCQTTWKTSEAVPIERKRGQTPKKFLPEFGRLLPPRSSRTAPR